MAWSQIMHAQVWVSDNGDGAYKNPVLYADYSDPDLIRAGDDYYMTASSFNCVPGLPILHSKDLANWKIINHALPKLRMEGVEPANFFDTPQHGKGVWAPCIRHHKGEFYIYWGDPDFGVYVVKTKDITGKWDEPRLVLPGKGRIDPSPLFDDDGKVYLLHAWAGSRAGLNSILTVCEMNEDGTKAAGTETLVFDGNDGVNHTVEGGKFYKKDGYYYILRLRAAWRRAGNWRCARKTYTDRMKPNGFWRRERPASTGLIRADWSIRQPANGASCTFRTKALTAASSTCSRSAGKTAGL